MALFEGYERRIEKINATLKEYGIKSVEECRDICLSKGVDCDKLVRGTQPICFENAVWAYTVGAATEVTLSMFAFITTIGAVAVLKRKREDDK